MIDQTLIDKNISQACGVIENELIATESPYLWQIQNLFCDDLIEKIRQYISVEDNQYKWQIVEQQEKLNRRKITWDADTVIEESHVIFDALTSSLNERFSDIHKNFLGMSLWKDSEGYSMGWHTDNPIIDVSIQLFLFDTASPTDGTIFKINDKDFLIPYVSNTGYLCVQTHDAKLLHKPATVLSSSKTRYSLYSVWSRFTKHVADSQ